MSLSINTTMQSAVQRLNTRTNSSTPSLIPSYRRWRIFSRSTDTATVESNFNRFHCFSIISSLTEPQINDDDCLNNAVMPRKAINEMKKSDHCRFDCEPFLALGLDSRSRPMIMILPSLYRPPFSTLSSLSL